MSVINNIAGGNVSCRITLIYPISYINLSLMLCMLYIYIFILGKQYIYRDLNFGSKLSLSSSSSTVDWRQCTALFMEVPLQPTEQRATTSWSNYPLMGTRLEDPWVEIMRIWSKYWPLLLQWWRTYGAIIIVNILLCDWFLYPLQGTQE